MLKKILVPIHPDGWRFIGIFGVIAAGLFWLSSSLGWISLILTLWCVYFFRNPPRVTPTNPGLIISPADGIVQMITSCLPPKEFDVEATSLTRISIFLNVFDVHVNRIPIDGRIEKIVYHPGQFLNASLDKASDLNERQTLLIRTPENHNVFVVQIAGLVARRIRKDITEGEQAFAGQVFGLIRFGSRVDVYLPKGVHSSVVIGQRMIAGETILADLTSKKPPQQGEIR